MRLTVYTDFSLRVLMYLALHPDKRPTISEVSSRYDISKNHIMKVVHQLGVAGYIETMRGKGGGMRLARSPSDVVLGEVVRRTEPDMALVPCFEPVSAPCVISPACVLRRALGEAQSAFLAVLDGYTLADLADHRGGLNTLFEQAVPMPAPVVVARSKRKRAMEATV